MTKLSLWISLSFAATLARAGQPSGPYLVWADLTERIPSQQTQFLHDFNQSEPDNRFCGEYSDQRLLYVHERPIGFSNSLLTEALIEKDSLARKKLIGLVRNLRDDGISDGIDGVVVFTTKGGTKIISFDVHGKTKEARVKSPNDKTSFIKSFCAVLPEVFRD